VVIDSSVLINALGDFDEPGEVARQFLRRTKVLIAPDVLISETFTGLRGLWIRRKLTTAEFLDSCLELVKLPIDLRSNRELVLHAVVHRHNVGGSDSLFVALAEAEGLPLATSDGRLSRASGISCEVVNIRKGSNRS
jgi:predicted nucleic acid-binding protein